MSEVGWGSVLPKSGVSPRSRRIWSARRLARRRRSKNSIWKGIRSSRVSSVSRPARTACAGSSSARRTADRRDADRPRRAPPQRWTASRIRRCRRYLEVLRAHGAQDARPQVADGREDRPAGTPRRPAGYARALGRPGSDGSASVRAAAAARARGTASRSTLAASRRRASSVPTPPSSLRHGPEQLIALDGARHLDDRTDEASDAWARPRGVSRSWRAPSAWSLKSSTSSAAVEHGLEGLHALLQEDLVDVSSLGQEGHADLQARRAGGCRGCARPPSDPPRRSRRRARPAPRSA